MARGVVVTHFTRGPGYARTHEALTRAAIGRELADLLGYDFAGEYDPAARYPGPAYFVPGDTLVGAAQAAALGVRAEGDLFGGVVPHAVAATKAITHPLVRPGAAAPPGWPAAFPERVRDAVLPGFAAFALPDAREAGERLLELGPVRVKRAEGSGWRDQAVARDLAELDAVLEGMNRDEVARAGLVLEQNLAAVTTYSVGQVRVGGLVATYYGTQQVAADNGGKAVYGGTDLVLVRGGYEELLRLELAPDVRLGVAQARTYDEAADAMPGFLASRRNYDVAQGLDARGRWRSGVLEQSWRVGGASGPEVAALAAFRAEPAVRAVHAWCVEAFGAAPDPPARAVVHFRGTDERVGPITKYTLLEAYDTPG